MVRFHLSFGREMQDVVSMAAIVAEPRKIGKENIHYICNTTVDLSWGILVCEGLSRHTAGARTVGGTIKARVQVMVEVIVIL